MHNKVYCERPEPAPEHSIEGCHEIAVFADIRINFSIVLLRFCCGLQARVPDSVAVTWEKRKIRNQDWV